MLASDIIARVRGSFGDTNSVELTDNTIIRWINDAMREIVSQSELLQVKSTTAPINSVNHYCLPPDMLKTHSIKFQGNTLEFVSLEQAEELFPNKDDSTNYPTGTPTHYWIWGGELYLYPAPSFTGTNEISCYYNRMPVEIALTTDTPEIPSIYHNRIVEYCLAQAYELDESVFISELKLNQFTSNLQNMKTLNEWEGQDAYPFITSTDEYGPYGAYY